MKIMINYDFFNKIRDAKEPLGPLKIIRTKSGRWLPIYLVMNTLVEQDVQLAMIHSCNSFLILTMVYCLFFRIMGKDIVAETASNDLKKLAIQLNDMNVSTDLELLFESELYKREYKFFIREDKIPSILESKYIMVPTYDNGDIKEVSIVQEHELGTKSYVLSLGSPMKKTKLAYSGV